MRLTSLIVGAVVALLAVPVVAQTPEGTPTRIRGTVEKLDGQTLVVKSREGQTMSIALAPNFVVTGVVKKSLADIKKGDFIGSAAIKGTDGKLHAQEVLIFPEAARGSNEGHYGWDLTPGGTMTNATVAEVESLSKDRVMKLKHKDGENEIEVSPDTPIVTFAPGDATLLKPGAAVFVPALKKADGALTAARVVAEKDGVKPPM